MNKNLNQNLMWVIGFGVIVLGVYLFMGGKNSGIQDGAATTSANVPNTVIGIKDAPQAINPTPAKAVPAKVPATTEGRDIKNATYIVEGAAVKLVNGVSSSGMTRYFGNEAVGDLNGDIIPDTALIISQSPGGSGTFYYLVAAIKTNNGYKGTNAVLIGDRIVPSRTDIGGGDIVVNYTDRKPGEPMTTKPSLGKTKQYYVKNGTLMAR